MADISTEELERIEREYHSGSDNIKPIQEFSKPEDLYDELIASIRKYHPSTDITLIEKAYHVAFEAHKGQVRKSGEAYIIHPLCVAIILAELELDKETIAAGLLHDVLEDTVMTEEQMREEFGDEVLLLVDGVTKLQHLHLTDNIKNPKDKNADRLEMQAENLRKMFLAMAKDIRVIMIKLADRLHNMRTSRRCPIAQRLGISKIKIELEDLSLKYLEPEAYYDLVEKVALRKNVRDAYVQGLVVDVRREIEEAGIKAEISGRAKHFFSIYKKMVNQNKTIDQIYDLFAIRIIVDTVKDCYAALGIMHEKYKPIPGRFKDYIAMPKPNMYQSLHTTLIGPSGQPFEIQIRTFEMHRTAEYGIAAHWKYKIGMEGKDSLDERLAWIRQLLESQKDSDDVEDIVKSIKTDIAPEEVFVFTPRGDVIRLPQGSTVVDFAYAIHSEVGNKMIGAKVDGRLVSLDYKVKTGMIVEIITSTTQSNGPSRDWLKIVKTSEARNKIRSWFKKEKREENIAEGKLALEKEMRRNLIAPPQEEREKFIADIATRQKYNTVDDFYASIGYGGISLEKIMPRVKDDFIRLYRKPEQTLAPTVKKTSQKASNGVIVEGLDGCLIKFARCCNPLPGDEIVGFITRGFGVSIHKCDCANVVNARRRGEDPERWVNATWASKVKETFKSTLDILASDRIGILADVSVQLGNMRVPIHSVMAKELKTGQTSIQVSIGISDLNQLQTIINNLSRIPGVSSVKRAVLS